MLLEVDVQGARAVKEALPEAIVVFLRAPSSEAQRERLEGRGADDEAAIERRLAAAAREEAEADAFDAVVVNDDVDRATDEIAGILARSRGTSRSAGSSGGAPVHDTDGTPGERRWDDEGSR